MVRATRTARPQGPQGPNGFPLGEFSFSFSFLKKGSIAFGGRDRMEGVRVWLPVPRDGHVPASELRRTATAVTFSRWRAGGGAEEVELPVASLVGLHPGLERRSG